ncbi:DUF3842 family protein [Clostridium sp. D33t1_170424_F3]|uniref:DUF3842 family protein n=1 Tax=Clostridium sp. D33t1_170424_F3 TaxID=2787099 RepID=UPI0018AABAAD|nr:DUF3842 family protein [Clostridium sp. D33t1_170424_F3]
MQILVIDGQGGGIGKCLIEKLRQAMPQAQIVAVGTNSLATSAMLKAGASVGATGENPAVFNAKSADVIAGPIGIIMANAMWGEITPAMAAAVSGSPAQKVLIPIEKCRIHVAGNVEKPLTKYIEEAVAAIQLFMQESM